MAATRARAVVEAQLVEDLAMARVADEDRDPGGPRRRDEPALVADLDDDDRDAARPQAERDAIADRAEPGDDDVVVDVARARSGGRGSGAAASG